jgi:hypothetical protein
MDREGLIIQNWRKLASADFRDLSPHAKALKLICDEKISINLSADIVGLDHRCLSRAQVAVIEGRSIGRNRRPSIFNDQENTDLIAHLKDLPVKNFSGNGQRKMALR